MGQLALGLIRPGQAIPQSKDCKNHFDKKKEKGKGTVVFICEGQSTAGSITSCRDVNNQAVFVLKGKPLNVWDLKRDVMYKNDEDVQPLAGAQCRGQHRGPAL